MIRYSLLGKFLLLFLLNQALLGGRYAFCDDDRVKWNARAPAIFSHLPTPLDLKEKIVKWLQIPPAERREIKKRYMVFKCLGPHQRRIFIEKYEFFRKLSAEKKRRILHLHSIWMRLPQQKRDELLLRFKKICVEKCGGSPECIYKFGLNDIFSPQELSSFKIILEKSMKGTGSPVQPPGMPSILVREARPASSGLE